MLNNYITLSNNVKMPIIGFGTYKTGDENETIKSVKNALLSGYRMIDAASFYKNEEAVGKGIKESGVNREEIFLASKVWIDAHGYENTIKSFNESLKRLDVKYLDLYLIHWPTKLNNETYRALETLYKEGKVRAIGVCNFKPHHLKDLMEYAEIPPMVNQIEIHPRRTQKETISYCKRNNIQVVAWGPLSRGVIFSNPIVNDLSLEYGKDIGQIILRWHLQNGVVPIPKSSKLERIKSNINIFDFEISSEDMKKLDDLNTDESISSCPEGTIYFE